MSSFLFANDFSTTLAAAATTSDTTLTLTATTNFPSSIPAGIYVPVILLDQATQSVYEVCYASAISGSNITVVRAREGTTANSWSIGDYIYCAPTAQTVAPVGAYAYNGQFGNNVDTTQTASFTLTTADSGKTFDTKNFTAAGTITLPATATEGNYFGIIPNATYQITVSPNGGSFQFADGSTSTANYNMTTVVGSIAWFLWNGSYWQVLDFGKFVVSDAVNANEAVAYGQVGGMLFSHSVADVTASRAFGTTYTNSHGYPMGVYVSMSDQTGDSDLLVCSMTLPGGSPVHIYGSRGIGNAVSYTAYGFWIIPPGAVFNINRSGSDSVTISKWVEVY